MARDGVGTTITTETDGITVTTEMTECTMLVREAVLLTITEDTTTVPMAPEIIHPAEM